MHIQLQGKLTENIGGIGLFKHSFDINYGADLPHADDIFSVPFGPLKLQGGISVVPERANPSLDDVVAHLDLVFLGMTEYSLKATLAEHISLGAQPIHVDKGQIKFDGTLTVTA